MDKIMKRLSNLLSVKSLVTLLLATADVAYFASGWKNARGCKIEHICAEQYGIKIVEA